MPFKTLQTKRRFIHDKIVIGIDPSKNKHQIAVIDHCGIQIGNAFTFKVSYKGYTQELWIKLKKLIPKTDSEDCVFAIETACNLWQTITFFLKAKGFTVLLVSPLSTKHTRPAMNHDFSKTDPIHDLDNLKNNLPNFFCDFPIITDLCFGFTPFLILRERRWKPVMLFGYCEEIW